MLYKLIFSNRSKIYELYCSQVSSSNLYGFIEAEGLVFSTSGGVVLDPTEEKLKQEFDGVETLFLPMHSIVRIESVKSRGKARIRDIESGDTVTPFPLPGPGSNA